MIKYMVMSLEHTAQTNDLYPLGFNYKRLEKYIGKTGEEIPHDYKPKYWKNYACLMFSEYDIKWFNKKDLVMVCEDEDKNVKQ